MRLADALVIFQSFQILGSTTAFCLAIAMLFLISLVQSPSADLYDPRNLKSCTCSNDSPSFSEIDHDNPFAKYLSKTIQRILTKPGRHISR